jgi:hypothetical protein
MDKKVNTLLALMIVGAFPALSLYSWAQSPAFSADGASAVALTYLKGMPTYAFDGLRDSVEVVQVEPLRMLNTWEVTVAFTSSHSGYGDRAGMILLQVLTPHVTRIVVSEGKVTRAVTDEAYDELSQRDLASGILSPESARDAAIQYIAENYPGLADMAVPSEWTFTDLTPEGMLGASTYRYAGLGWNVTVRFMVVLEPVYTVTVEHSGDEGFTWEGTVESSGVTELSTSLSPEPTDILSPEQARDLAVEYVLANYPELKDVETPAEWEFTDLTPEGLLGHSTFKYTSGGWSVQVGFPVVWKPTYEVELTLSEPALEWVGTVSQDGTVTTIE